VTTFAVLNIAFLWLVVMFNTILIFALVRKVNADQSNSFQSTVDQFLSPGEHAPEFTWETLSGNFIEKSDFDDSQLVLLFVSPTCGPCRELMPDLDKLIVGAQQSGTNLLPISIGEKSSTEEIIQEFNVSTDFALASYSDEAVLAYQVPGTHSYYVIDREGQITRGGFMDVEWRKLVASWKNTEQSH